jgi:hypothetical protein
MDQRRETMLKIDKELFQWEKGRYVIVNNPNITTVEFYNKKSKQGTEEYVVNGKAKIPNFLLQENLPIVALACTDDEDGTKVISRKVFKVLPRPKPEFYVDDDESPINPDIPGVDIIYDGGVEV